MLVFTAYWCQLRYQNSSYFEYNFCCRRRFLFRQNSHACVLHFSHKIVCWCYPNNASSLLIINEDVPMPLFVLLHIYTHKRNTRRIRPADHIFWCLAHSFRSKFTWETIWLIGISLQRSWVNAVDFNLVDDGLKIAADRLTHRIFRFLSIRLHLSLKDAAPKVPHQKPRQESFFKSKKFTS